jgi:SagB-type dehydrogenase family enzyme
MKRDGSVARAFHEATKHSRESVSGADRVLDWDNKPHPFKIYESDLERVPAPALLALGAGVLRKQTYGGETIYFRTYASAGALYPVEIYAIDASGTYHFDPLGKALQRLRSGDSRGAVVAACAGGSAVSDPSTFLVLTGIPWRTGWKYGSRGYRHLFWDAGTILANLLALAGADATPSRVVLGFEDDAVARLVGVDGVREFPLCIVALGEAGEIPPIDDVPGLDLSTLPVSPREERFELIDAAHAAGRLGGDEVAPWRGRSDRREHVGQPPLPDEVERVIGRRGSARQFGPGAIPADDLTKILAYATAPISTDYSSDGSRLVRVFACVHAVDGLEPGRYAWTGERLELLRTGDVRRESAYLCLGQRLGGQGAATLFLMADLEAALARFGDRGYRLAQLDAGITLGRIDLASHALGYGATGLTFFDDDVRTFFSPAAASLECMLASAVGERRGRLLPLA